MAELSVINRNDLFFVKNADPEVMRGMQQLNEAYPSVLMTDEERLRFNETAVPAFREALREVNNRTLAVYAGGAEMTVGFGNDYEQRGISARGLIQEEIQRRIGEMRNGNAQYMDQDAESLIYFAGEAQTNNYFQERHNSNLERNEFVDAVRNGQADFRDWEVHYERDRARLSPEQEQALNRLREFQQGREQHTQGQETASNATAERENIEQSLENGRENIQAWNEPSIPERESLQQERTLTAEDFKWREDALSKMDVRSAEYRRARAQLDALYENAGWKKVEQRLATENEKYFFSDWYNPKEETEDVARSRFFQQHSEEVVKQSPVLIDGQNYMREAFSDRFSAQFFGNDSGEALQRALAERRQRRTIVGQRLSLEARERAARVSAAQVKQTLGQKVGAIIGRGIDGTIQKLGKAAVLAGKTVVFAASVPYKVLKTGYKLGKKVLSAVASGQGHNSVQNSVQSDTERVASVADNLCNSEVQQERPKKRKKMANHLWNLMNGRNANLEYRGIKSEEMTQEMRERARNMNIDSHWAEMVRNRRGGR